MKISREIILMFIVGLLILAYLLDAVVNPLDISLPTPYHFFQVSMMSQFPFSAASVFIKGLALFLIPLWVLSFISKHFFGKAAFLLVFSSLAQLFALQDVVTKAEIVPMEWDLSISVAGVGLLLYAGVFVVKGIISAVSNNVQHIRMEAALVKQQQHSQQKSSTEILQSLYQEPPKEGGST